MPPKFLQGKALEKDTGYMPAEIVIFDDTIMPSEMTPLTACRPIMFAKMYKDWRFHEQLLSDECLLSAFQALRSDAPTFDASTLDNKSLKLTLERALDARLHFERCELVHCLSFHLDTSVVTSILFWCLVLHALGRHVLHAPVMFVNVEVIRTRVVGGRRVSFDVTKGPERQNSLLLARRHELLLETLTVRPITKELNDVFEMADRLIINAALLRVVKVVACTELADPDSLHDLDFDSIRHGSLQCQLLRVLFWRPCVEHWRVRRQFFKSRQQARVARKLLEEPGVLTIGKHEIKTANR